MPFSLNHCRLVETGSWTIPDLIKYLVSIQFMIQPVEIEQLRDNPVFPKETTTEPDRNEDGALSEVPRLKASDLYEPSDIFRNLGLPVIDWRGKDGERRWKSNSKGGTCGVA